MRRRYQPKRLVRKTHRTAWRCAVLTGVLTVALGTTCTLILPGVTMEGEETLQTEPTSSPVETADPGQPNLLEGTKALDPEETPAEENAAPVESTSTESETDPEGETAPTEENAAPVESTPAESGTDPEGETAPSEEAAAPVESTPAESETGPEGETAPSEEAAAPAEVPPPETEPAPEEAAPEPTETPDNVLSLAPTEETAPLSAEAAPEEGIALAAAEEGIALAAVEDAPLIQKECARDGDVLTYSLTINPNAQDLVAGQLRVVDTLTYYVALSSSATASLAHGSVTAYQILPNGNEIPLDTSTYRYTYQEDVEQKTIFFIRRNFYTNTLSIDIPDKTAVRIEYQYTLYGTSGWDWNLHDFTNTARLQDADSQAYLSDTAQLSLDTISVSGLTEDVTALVIHTVDSSNHGVSLPNQAFTLWRFDGSDYVRQGDFSTDDQGFYTFTALEHNTAYHITKGEAPPGYVSDEIPVYFYINCGFSHSRTLPSSTEGFQAISPQGHIDLTYTRDHAQVTVKVNWWDTDGNPGSPVQDALEFELLQNATAADGTAVGAPMSMGRFSLARDSWTWTSSSLEYFLPAAGEKDGQSVTYSYWIREDLSVPGHYISYSASLDAIIVSIRENYYLPSTGGGGTTGYLAGGLALTLGAGYLLSRARKRKGGLSSPS